MNKNIYSISKRSECKSCGRIIIGTPLRCPNCGTFLQIRWLVGAVILIVFPSLIFFLVVGNKSHKINAVRIINVVEDKIKSSFEKAHPSFKEKPIAPKDVVVAPKVEEPVTPKEAVVAPKVEEPVTPKEAVVAVPAVTNKNLAQGKNKQIEIKSASEKAEWIYYETSDAGDMYYDKSRIKKINENIISVWNKDILSEKAKTKYFSILKRINKAPKNLSMLSYYTKLTQIDCVNRKIKDISVIIYNEKGKVVYSSPKSESSEWNDILPNTVGEKLINIVSCETVTPAVTPNEAVIAPKVEEPVTPKEAVVAAPAVIDKNPAQVKSNTK